MGCKRDLRETRSSRFIEKNFVDRYALIILNDEKKSKERLITKLKMLRLAGMLARQLRAAVEVSCNAGTEFAIAFDGTNA